MCGIVGYVGKHEAQPCLLAGLHRLEYRGYDSAGLATVSGRVLAVRKCAGRVDRLAELVATEPAPGQIGISHTRWATHGPPNDNNAHPHVSQRGRIALVHNGVIENYQQLRVQLEHIGYTIKTETDTEVLAHLIEHHLNGELPSAVGRALAEVRGTYAIAVISHEHPRLLVGARSGSPLVVGLGEEEQFLCSDPSALAEFTQEMVYLGDHEMVVLDGDMCQVMDKQLNGLETRVEHIDWDVSDSDLGEFPHYMLKEIFEQPKTIESAMRGRLSEEHASAAFHRLNIDTQTLRSVDRLILTACGTSWHAGLVGEYLIEEIARMPVEVEYASELRYRNPPIDTNSLVFTITQSGETADTLAALHESKRKGHHTLAICNVEGSSIAREADGCIYLHAGPEIGVASTKAFTSQVTALTMLALYLGRMRHVSSVRGAEMITELARMPEMVQRTLECNDHVRGIAERYCHCSNFLYLGRQYNFPVALEGALKLKEISYIHAEGYPAAEMKHGPIALVDRDTPSLFIMPRGVLYDKIMSNLEEIRARGGPVIALATEGDTEVAQHADDVVYLPEVPEYLQPLVTVVPLQLLAYHIAVLRGCDVDRPRNLAKSVTVE